MPLAPPNGSPARGRRAVAVALLTTLAAVTAAAGTALAQQPRISALYPAGGKAGETVEVAVKGGGLIGAKQVVVLGPGGVTGEIVGGNATVDEKAKPLFQSKCTNCHEARSPANRSLTPEQWAATTDRMINQRGADINKADRDVLVAYLQALAKAGQVTARFKIAADAAPGIREVRIVTMNGATTAYAFEVGSVPETFATEPNSAPATPQKVTLPTVVNGVLAQGGERDYFAFDVKKGQRLVFNLKGYRLNEQSQAYFNPSLYLTDAQGKPLAHNSGGRFELDPVLDWTAPEDGTYTLLVRDLLYKGSPSSVYRLTMGALPYDAVLTPPAGRPGQTLSAHMIGSLPSSQGQGSVTVQVPEGVDGVTTVATPMGDAPFLVRDLPDGGSPVAAASAAGAPAVALPALFKGTLGAPGRTDVFKVKTTKPGDGLEVYAKRLGSPLRAKVTVKNANGQPVGDRTAQGDEDVRLERVFTQPGEYYVEITDADGNGGPQFSYAWESTESGPDFALTALPDVVNIGPGARMAVLVRVIGRESVAGPITVTVKNLPAGVTAQPAVLPPDDDKAVVLLEAAPGAATGSASVVTIEGAATEGGVNVVRRARPIEVYRVNNNPKLQPRSSQMVAVIPDPVPFTLSTDTGDALALAANEEVPVKVRVQRAEGVKGDVYLGFIGLPPGVNIRGNLSIPANQTEQTIYVRADGNARFLKERPGLPPLHLIFTARLPGMGDEQMVTCASPIALQAKPPK